MHQAAEVAKACHVLQGYCILNEVRPTAPGRNCNIMPTTGSAYSVWHSDRAECQYATHDASYPEGKPMA